MKLPCLGWVVEPSPLERWPELEGELGLDALLLKRDDQLPALHGGSKVRKLDALLAVPPLRTAPRLGGVGGLGSGQLVALIAAGELLGKPVDVHVFPTEASPHAAENFAFVASRAASITAYRDRPDLALRAPGVVRGTAPGLVPAGATTPEGMVAMALAGLELAEQIDGAPPDRLYVGYGSMGTALGLAAGLRIAGLPTVVHAVSAVERLLRPKARERALRRQLAGALAALGQDGDAAFTDIVVSGAQVGRGYGFATPASTSAAAALRARGLAGEPAYTGKALAQLVADAPTRGFRRAALWMTGRRGPLPEPAPGWRARVPRVLAEALDGKLPPLGPTRRTVFAGLGAALATAFALRPGETLGPPFDGLLLSPVEADVLRAVARTVLPPAPLDDAVLARLPARIDTFTRTLPETTRRELHALLHVVEYGSPLMRTWPRFSRLADEDRPAAWAALSSLPRVGSLLARAARDLVLVGYYSDEAHFAAIGYTGPLVGADVRSTPYDALRAPPGPP